MKFMDYWDLINKKLDNSELSQKEPMRRLNASRVNFKHYGTLPSKFDIEGFRANVTNFFNENTPLIFNIDFISISLTEVVQSTKVREKLELATKFMNENNVEKALGNIAIAFDIMINEYESNKTTFFGQSPFYMGESLTFQRSSLMGYKKYTGDPKEQNLAEFIDIVKDSVEALQKAVKMLSLGLDYRKYTKFKLLVPSVAQDANGGYHIGGIINSEKYLPSREDFQFCIDFVIECYLKLQEFDYTIDKELYRF